jgi:cytochrome c biogenesis protein CcmG, thiol:disulfide interchange protein DsbE
LPALLEDGPGVATADLKGTPVLVNVFASWCGPCRAEHPLLMRLAEQGVALYGIDFKDRPEEARAWLARVGNPYRRIGTDRAGASTIDWGVYGVPETFLVDATGTIRFRQVGPLSPGVVETSIWPLLRHAQP